jgi:hypothetical protein
LKCQNLRKLQRSANYKNLVETQFEMSKFKKITKKGKIQKLVETQKPSCFFNPVHLWSKYWIIDNIFVSYNLVDQKDEVKNIVVKKSHYGRGSKPWEPMKEDNNNNNNDKCLFNCHNCINY